MLELPEVEGYGGWVSPPWEEEEEGGLYNLRIRFIPQLRPTPATKRFSAVDGFCTTFAQF